MKSCNEVRKHGRSESGYYSLHLGRPRVAKVYCDLSSSDGPWTVIQRRIYSTPPTDYASKTWENYRDGFGESEANFWLGNNYIHELTKIPQRLKITLHTADFNIYEAIYEDFTIGDEASKFVLSFGAYSGGKYPKFLACVHLYYYTCNALDHLVNSFTLHSDISAQIIIYRDSW